MYKITRRKFISVSASLPVLLPVKTFSNNKKGKKKIISYPTTIQTLQKAFESEMIAHKHYVEFTQKAIEEKYVNIAYMFHVFSLSEKIHADNYKRTINELGSNINDHKLVIEVNDTQSNVLNASQREMEKIEKTYPHFLQKLESESYEEAITHCMYSWKSHQQHEHKIKKLQKYSGLFFSAVSSQIESKNFDFHVCEICGSTIDEKPTMPCIICNKSLTHYNKISRPA